jgi:hypothetical protein
MQQISIFCWTGCCAPPGRCFLCRGRVWDDLKCRAAARGALCAPSAASDPPLLFAFLLPLLFADVLTSHPSPAPSSPPPSRTKWTRLAPPSVLSGHVSPRTVGAAPNGRGAPPGAHAGTAHRAARARAEQPGHGCGLVAARNVCVQHTYLSTNWTRPPRPDPKVAASPAGEAGWGLGTQVLNWWCVYSH